MDFILRQILLHMSRRSEDPSLTGKAAGEQTVQDWGLVSQVVDFAQDVARHAVETALEMFRNSPDSLLVDRRGIRLS